jgi:transposase
MAMRKRLGQVESCVGVDISERWLAVHLLPSGEHAGFSRDRRGIARLVAWLANKGRLLVVVEATGGLERGLRAALAQAGIAVAVVNPRQVRDFARLPGRSGVGAPLPNPTGQSGLLAKTDRLDAYALALYGERMRPAPSPARAPADQALAALVLRRRQLAQLIEAERNRSRRTEAPLVLASTEAHLGWLQVALAELEEQIEARLAADPVWQDRATLLSTVPGVGKVTVSTLLAPAA